ncbi:unnamed protein product [Rhizoctonia solani]|uniref:Uncharacterized protein n=1 Tax=Rhizoctonia solani TaxID=456999 RepID=A0A8H3GXX7_9AGAM|nr:unnamed protein product [Rhizoctonia solani]
MLGLAPPRSQSPPPYHPSPNCVQPPEPPTQPFDDHRIWSLALEQPRFFPRFAPYDPDDPNQHDSDRKEDNEDDKLDGFEWTNGLTARECYAQDAQHELLQQGGLQSPEYHRLTVQAFDYKVDTNISGRAYTKLPRAFPDHLGDLPMDPKLQKQINKISEFTSRSIHCCVNSTIQSALQEPHPSGPSSDIPIPPPHPMPS